MTYVITDDCTKDGLCLDTCPNDSIRPRTDEADFDSVPQLYINPDDCLDCGACEPVCPSNALFPADSVPAEKQYAIAANAAYFANQ